MKSISDAQDVIHLKQKQIKLLEELQLSVLVENYKYYVDKQSGIYFLVQTSDRKVIKREYQLSKIVSWLKIRNITNYIQINP